jgi:hypothetical protein
MYLIEIVCATVVIYVVVVQMQKYWCKFQAHNTCKQEHAEQETGYGQPSELVLGNIQSKECGNHSSMQVPTEETNAGSTAKLAL